MWVGVDDTDGPDGGCTTFVLTELIALGRELGLAPIGWPRLVRLNPNVPWKTRGNGALAVRLGRGTGPASIIGRVRGRPVLRYAAGRAPTPPQLEAFRARAWPLVDALAASGVRSDPGLVISPHAPAPGFYRDAVADAVSRASADRVLAAVGGSSFHRGGGRGTIGATAAIAWPGRRRTFEYLAYRRPGAIGRPREVEGASVVRAARKDRRLFQCFDPRTRRLLVTPHTDCPILYGLRGRDPASVRRAARTVRSEPVDRWMVFASNQGTGDHWRSRSIGDWPAYSSGIVLGQVADIPRVLRGGHARFEVADGIGAALTCMVFEPTKGLADLAARLRPGDRVRVAGGRGADGPVRVERIVLVQRSAESPRRQKPYCGRCAVRTQSLGAGRGFRCPQCRARYPPETALPGEQLLRPGPGVYDPTPSARRHLHPVAV